MEADVSFRFIDPAPAGYLFRGLPEGDVSITRDGLLTARRDDLALVSITDRLVIGIDDSNFRLCFRAPRDGEDAIAVTLRDRKSKGGATYATVKFSIRPALRELKLKVADVAGRYTLTAVDDLLLFALKVERPATTQTGRNRQKH